MFGDLKYINKFIDVISEGFIFIDNKGIVQIYNRKAKEIFGVIYNNKGRCHDAGTIKKGDIVIIADNYLGRDDGGLVPEDLKVIGVKNDNFDIGDSIIAIGTYKDETTPAIFKAMKGLYKEHFQIATKYKGFDIKVSIEADKKLVSISINKEEFTEEYINALGHMVVLDGEKGNIKFYQAKGYTIRRESIKEILAGKNFMAKGKDTEGIQVIGKDIFELHGAVPEMKSFYEVARGKNLSFTDKFIEINGRPTLCTLIPIDEKGKRIGAVLRVEDITELKRLTKERDKALHKIEEMEKRLRNEEEIDKLFPEIVGESKEMKNVKKMAYKASKTNSTVLLLGESGTGKTVLAKNIHHASNRDGMPFIHVNCASIPETLIESEFFGYEEGAFTGAKTKGKKGYFEIAHGGTIFLDEIAELPISMQVKLLQVLQNRSFYRVGGNKEINVDVRIIAATNKNLEKETEKGNFREDLFYRINIFPIWIPPLRERKEDIHQLVYNLLPSICNRIGTSHKHISGEGLKKLMKYDWPGNVRELENILERAVNLSEGDNILSNHIKVKAEREDNIENKKLKEIVKEAEKEAIINALKKCDGDKKCAMKSLGIGKTSFYEKLKKYSIDS